MEIWEVAHDRVTAAFDRLRKSASVFRMLTPQQFLEADLDRLAADGIFPEIEFLAAFQEGIEAEILPIC